MSHHVTRDVTLLTNVNPIIACQVDLSNGQQVVATQKGHVILSKDLTFSNFLFVPSLQCHLLYVS